MNKKSAIFVLVLIVTLFSACDGLFTSSLASWASRDFEDLLKNASAEEIADFLLSPQALSKEDSEKLVNALASKSAKELQALSAEQKAAIINTSVSAILPDTEAIGSLVNFQDIESAELINESLGEINTDVNTAALTALLSDPNLDEVEDSAVLLGTLCLAGSIANKNGVDIDAAAPTIAGALATDETTGKVSDTATNTIESSIGATSAESSAIVNATEIFANSETAKELEIDVSGFIDLTR